MIEGLNAADYLLVFLTLILEFRMSFSIWLYYASLAFFCSVFTPQSRDWVWGNGYCVVIIPGLPRIRNAILIMISITFSIVCSLAFSLSSRRKHGRQGDDWAPGDVEVLNVSP